MVEVPSSIRNEITRRGRSCFECDKMVCCYFDRLITSGIHFELRPEIKKLVQKYTRRKEKFRKQVGRPTWASNSGLSKRPRSESSEMEPSNLKRQKDGTGR